MTTADTCPEVEIEEVLPHTGDPMFQAQCHTHDWCSKYRNTYTEAENDLVEHEDAQVTE
jgi:hypothetical protein